MGALGTLHGRILALWSVVFGGWALALFLELFGASWHGFMIGIAVAAAWAGGMALIACRAFRRVVRRPLPQRGIDGWLARRPWRAAVIAGIACLAVPAVVLGSPAVVFGQYQAPLDLVGTIGVWATFAVGQSAFWLLVFREQRQPVARPRP